MTRKWTRTDTKRRRVLRSAGTALIGIAAGAAPASAQRPTLVARSSSCETISLGYDDSGPPVIRVKADGPEVIETTVERGETVDLNAKSGTYDIEAWPANGSRDGSRSIMVDGEGVDETVAVEECIPPGINAYLECSSVIRPILFENPLDTTVWIHRYQYETDGTYRSEALMPLAPGELTREYGHVLHIGDEPRYYVHEYYIYRDRVETDDGEYRGVTLLPINGQLGPLIADKPCEELDIG